MALDANQRNIRIGIDTGGTFTDIVLVDGDTGEVVATKVPSTPANPALGLVRGIDAILSETRKSVARLAGIAHGTTVATNALLQGEVAGLGLIVTQGFRHTLEIARQTVPDGYGNSYFWVKPKRLVPLHLVHEVGGRMNVRGEELLPLDEESVIAAARGLKAANVRAIGICLIHAYANDAHERRVGEILSRELPDAFVSLSCDVLPEYREYERTVTTLVDAFVKPYVTRYLAQVKSELGTEISGSPFLVMQSSGGVMSAEQVVEKPISTALSGPAAGALGSAVIAELAGFPNLVTLDAGGTSTDLCLIEKGSPSITTAGSVGPFPVRIPMIAIETIGTGGGSIAHVDREGGLRVGPRSAGADPGPMCYPQGGGEPTITDANLALGRLPAGLIGGGIALDVERARAGIAALGDRLGAGHGVEQLAEGIIEIANWAQADRIRQMTIQRGIDPRDFALLSFGGAGPAQSAAVMELLGMAACLVPPNPGNLSALGLLAVDWRTDHSRTLVMEEESVDLDALDSVFAELEAEALGALERDGISPAHMRLVREADVRYVGQSMEVRVNIPAGPVSINLVERLANNFHEAHLRIFGYDYRERQRIEIVNWRVSGFGVIDRPQLPRIAAGTSPTSPRTKRHAWFLGGWIDTPVYDRETLTSGATVEGPAIIEEFGSTTVVFPSQCCSVDPHGILIIRSGARA